jgi:hypothetical protein
VALRPRNVLLLRLELLHHGRVSGPLYGSRNLKVDTFRYPHDIRALPRDITEMR